MHFLTRRSFLQNSLQLAPFFSTPGLFAERLSLTPHQTEGPFYPDHLPLDTDNDLLILNDFLTPAVGTVTYLSGAVLDRSGSPIQNALVEIWQVDSRGVYLHSRGGSRDKRDSHFQGYGRFLTDSKGRYSFRTLKPSPYSGRTPHIHFAVSSKGRRLLTTQCYIKGEPRNKMDLILNKIQSDQAKKYLLVDFKPVKEANFHAFRGRFDIILGITPSDE